MVSLFQIVSLYSYCCLAYQWEWILLAKFSSNSSAWPQPVCESLLLPGSNFINGSLVKKLGNNLENQWIMITKLMGINCTSTSCSCFSPSPPKLEETPRGVLWFFLIMFLLSFPILFHLHLHHHLSLLCNLPFFYFYLWFTWVIIHDSILTNTYSYSATSYSSPYLLTHLLIHPFTYLSFYSFAYLLT